MLITRPLYGAEIRYPRSALSPPHLEDIKTKLLVSNVSFFKARRGGYNTEDVATSVSLVRETTSAIYLPRHAPFAALKLPAPSAYRPATARQPVQASFEGNLRPYQHDAFGALLARLRGQEDGILALRCGWGKTVVAVAAWANACVGPMLAVMPTLFLVEQWKARILEFTNVTESEIGIFAQGRTDWEGKTIVLATIQSLVRKGPSLGAGFSDAFDVVFFDECHRLGADHFSQAAPLINATRIGLSATWAREDGMEALFTHHIGSVFFSDTKQKLKPKVYFLKTPAYLTLDNKYRMWGYKDLNYAKITTALSRLLNRQQFVIEHIILAAKLGRKILVLGDRKEELVQLHEKLRHLEQDSAICVGSLNDRQMSQDTRQEALQAQIILATSQLVKEGLDKKDIDTLFILYPQSNGTFTEQASGRILREDKDKHDPIVIVMHDEHVVTPDGSFAPYTNRCKKMAKVFERLGYPIQRAVTEPVRFASRA